MTTTKLLSIDKIQIDPAIQPRVKGLDKAHVTELAEVYADESRRGTIPPPVVWNIRGKGELKLSQGFHRLAAAQQAGMSQIECEVRVGSEVDCAIDALTSNKSHGLKRSNEDKRRAVNRLLELCPSDWSNAKIADMAGVTDTLVSDIRSKPLGPDKSDDPRKVVGKDGKTYTIKPKKTKADKQVAAKSDTPKPPETPSGQSDDKTSDETVTPSGDAAPTTTTTPPEPPAQPPKPPEPDEAEEVPELKKILSQLRKYIKANLADAAEISHKIGQVIDFITDMEAEMKPEETRPCYPQISHFNKPKVIGPKKYQSKSGKGTTILDAFGIPVQSQYADQFCERRYTQIALSISRAINYIEQAATDYDWLRSRSLAVPFFPGTEWDKYFTEAEQLLIDGHAEWANNALPWCVCRGCNGEPPRCKACRFTGIWGRDAVGAYPEIMAKASKTGSK
jgi:ParB-like chromosome segregation protein Spo0J